MSIWIVLKDLLIFARDRKSFVTLFLMPIILIAILGAAFGGLMGNGEDVTVQKFTVGYVDYDDSDFSKLLKEEVLETSLEEYIDLKEMTEAELETEIKDQSLGVGVIVPNNFSSSIEDGKETKIEIVSGHDTGLELLVVESGITQFSQLVQGRTSIGEIIGELNGEAVAEAEARAEAEAEALAEAIEQAKREAQSPEEAEAIEEQMLQQHEEKMTTTEVEIIEMPDFDIAEVSSLIAEQTVSDDTPPISSFQYYAAGMGVMFLLMTVVIVVGSMIEEKESQVYNRLLVSNLANRQYLLGKFLGIIFVSLLQLTIIILGTSLLFSINWGSSLSGIVLTVVSFTISAAGLGVFIGSFIKSEGLYSNIGIIGSQVLAALGGSMVPLYLFPEWMIEVSKVLPNALALQMFLELMAGAGVDAIATEALISIGVGIILFLLAWVRLSWKGGKKKHA